MGLLLGDSMVGAVEGRSGMSCHEFVLLHAHTVELMIPWIV